MSVYNDDTSYTCKRNNVIIYIFIIILFYFVLTYLKARLQAELELLYHTVCGVEVSGLRLLGSDQVRLRPSDQAFS